MKRLLNPRSIFICMVSTADLRLSQVLVTEGDHSLRLFALKRQLVATQDANLRLCLFHLGLLSWLAMVV